MKWLCNFCDKRFDAVLNRQNDFSDMDMGGVLQIVLAEMENISTVSADMSRCLSILSESNFTLSDRVANMDIRVTHVEKLQTKTKPGFVSELPAGGMSLRGNRDFSAPPPISRRKVEMAVQNVTSAVTVSTSSKMAKKSSPIREHISVMECQENNSQEDMETHECGVSDDGKSSYSDVAKRKSFSRSSNGVAKRKARRNLIVGSRGETDAGPCDGSDLVGRKRAWLFLGRIRKGTSIKKIEDFLGGNFPGLEFDVENLNSQGRYESFKLGTDFEHLDRLMDSECWPRDVIVRRFFFARPKKPPG